MQPATLQDRLVLLRRALILSPHRFRQHHVVGFERSHGLPLGFLVTRSMLKPGLNATAQAW
eukprot:2055474-Heterocapsa_arctica.AAC.1